MGDYYTLITRAVSALSDNTADARHNLYERARAALTSSLRRHDPPMSEMDFERERSAFEADIVRVEREASIGQTQTADGANAEPTQPQPLEETPGSAGPANILHAALPHIGDDLDQLTVSALEAGIKKVERAASSGQTQTADPAKIESIQSQPPDATIVSIGPAVPHVREDQPHPTVSAPEGITRVEQEPSIGQTQTVDTAKIESTQAQPAQETTSSNGTAATSLSTLQSIRNPTLPKIRPITNTFVYVNRALLSATCVIAIAIAVAILLGPSWATHILDYLMFAAYSAVILCAVGMLPIAQARLPKTGLLCTFLVSSYLLGMTTWLLGVLITLQYWGKMGLVIGLCLGIVGVVPLGIVAATMNADWSMVAMTIAGVLVTYGARDLALGLLDTENSSAISAQAVHSDFA